MQSVALRSETIFIQMHVTYRVCVLPQHMSVGIAAVPSEFCLYKRIVMFETGILKKTVVNGNG